jgi:hypothetical protein
MRLSWQTWKRTKRLTQLQVGPGIPNKALPNMTGTRKRKTPIPGSRRILIFRPLEMRTIHTLSKGLERRRM